MQCSVVIPCHNGAALTRACIDSLLSQDELAPTEIVLVDNASTDDTASLGSTSPLVRVLRLERNLGFAGGVNHGLRAARGDHVLVINNDTRAAPNLLRELHRALHSEASIGAAAPVSNHVKGEALLRIGNQARDEKARGELAEALRETAPLFQDVDTLSGLCLLMRRETVARVGYFDERFGHGNFEDDDFSLRLRLLGYRLVIARRAFLHHEGHATFRALGLDVRTEIERRLPQFVDKWHTHPAGRAAIAVIRHDAAGAAREARRAQAVAPCWPDAWMHLARDASRRGDHAAAASHLTAFLRRCPEHVEARLMLTKTLAHCGDRCRSNALLADTLARHWMPNDAAIDCFERLGQCAYQQGAHAEAELHFRAAVDLRPEHGALHNWLGLSLLGQSRPRDAIEHFARAIEHGHLLAHTNLGICHRALGDLDAAQVEFERAIVLLPRDPVARANYEVDAAARSVHAAAAAGATARSNATNSLTIS